jgi:hypothetical protein
MAKALQFRAKMSKSDPSQSIGGSIFSSLITFFATVTIFQFIIGPQTSLDEEIVHIYRTLFEFWRRGQLFVEILPPLSYPINHLTEDIQFGIQIAGPAVVTLFAVHHLCRIGGYSSDAGDFDRRMLKSFHLQYIDLTQCCPF